MNRYLAILAVALCACSGDKDGTTGDTAAGDDDDTAACTNSILANFPLADATDVYFKTDVRFTLAVEDPTAVITIADKAGTPVNGTTAVSGTQVTWSGDDFLPSTAYDVTLKYECGEAVISWTTSPVGGATTVDLTGGVYGLDVAGGQWVQPAGVGELLASQLGDTQIFLSVSEVVPDDSITMVGAIGSNATQDLCSPTIPFPPADWADPTFALVSPSLPLVVAGFTINIENLDLSGSFAPDGSLIQGGSLQGSIDTRPLGEAFGLGTGENAVCELVATFGVACEACSDGSGTFCLSVWVDNMGADKLETTVVPRTEQEIADDPACD